MQLKKIIAAAAVVFLLAGCADPDAGIIVTTSEAPTPSATETPVPTPSPTPTPTPEPTPTPDPYFTAEEQVVKDEENGHWLYSSPTLWIEVNRIFDE